MTEVVIAGLIITSDACGLSGCITGPAFVLPEHIYFAKHSEKPSELIG